MDKKSIKSPWAWLPTLYFAQGLPYVAVMTISVIMYKRMGISNTDIALYTGWLYLPWVIKPFWSPFVDIIRTKRWWTLAMQWLIAISFAGIAFSIPVPMFFSLTLAVFWLTAFMSATHDIAADGFYMLALSKHEQSLYVGIRSTFYRIATVAGQGLLVILAGLIETNSGLAPLHLTVNADVSYTQPINHLPAIIDMESDLDGELQFVTADRELYISPEPPTECASMPFAAYSKLMRDSVRLLNERNGFITPEVTEVATENKHAPSAFTRWVSETFGEHRATSSETAPGNFAIFGVRLNRAPEPGERVVLNFSHKSGDPGISLDSGQSRFVFDSSNWNKTAYLYCDVDRNLPAQVSTTFEGTSGNIPAAWFTVFAVLSAFFLIIALYHGRVLPCPVADDNRGAPSVSQIIKDFIDTFKSFFRKPNVFAAIAFMLLYRLPEAQLVKMINPFLLDPVDKGGLGLTTGQVGIVYGTIGIIGLTAGGLIGGIVASRGGLKKWLMPMAWSMSLTCLTFVYLSYGFNHSQLTINACVFIEQFGYGFGFTAYTLYMIYFSESSHKTAHYAICTGFMALGMMLPGMVAGWLQECIGYRHFFVWTIICCIATIGICPLLKIDPAFGRKK